MFQRILSHPLAHLVAIAVVAIGVVVCVFPHYVPRFSWGINYAVQLMLIYLFLGVFSLFLKQPRVTFVFFGGTLILCFFLKYSLKNDSINQWREGMIRQRMKPSEPEPLPVQLKVAHVNLSNVRDPAALMKIFRESNAELLSVHEVTPAWSQWLEDSLGTMYSQRHVMVDIGIFGMGIFSNLALENVDTFYSQDIPVLRGCLTKDGQTACFVSIHTEPALNDYSLKRLETQLNDLSSEINKMDVPIIVMGDFNAVSWAKEIQTFLDSTGLMESRTGFIDQSPVSWDVPIDHIFFSSRLSCAGFNNINGKLDQHIGITGDYQFKQQNEDHAKKTNR